MNKQPSEEEAKKAIEALESIENYRAGECAEIDEFLEKTQGMVDEVYKALKPTLDRLRNHDTGEEEIRPIKL